MNKYNIEKEGYCLTQFQIDNLTEDERKEREKQIELSREYIKNLEEDEF